MHHETELEAAETAGIDTDHLRQNMVNVDKTDEEGYSQKDQDRESEGLDDPDDDGEYHEN